MRVCNVHKSRRERERERERDDEKRMLAINYLVLLYVRLSLNCDLFFSRAHGALFEETLKAFLWRFSFFFLLWSRFLKIFFSNLSDADALAKNDSLTKKKKFASSSKKRYRKERCECEICRNEKQRRRRIRRVVLNRGVLRGSTREEEDVTMRVKRLIVAYGRRT